MKIKSFKDGTAVIDTDLIEARRIYSSKKTNAVQINLKPGAVVDTHTTEEDVFFLALEGSAEIYIAGERSLISALQSAECPGGVEKGIINNTDYIFKVLIVKINNL